MLGGISGTDHRAPTSSNLVLHSYAADILHCLALRRHRKSFNFYSCGFAVFEAYADFLEVKNRLLRCWRRSDLLHKRVEDSHHIHFRHAVWSRLNSSANVPLLLWAAICDGVDSVFPINHYCKPKLMAQNHSCPKST